MFDYIIHLRITDTMFVMRLASKNEQIHTEYIISIFFHCSIFEISLMTLRCISISQMDNMIEHILNDNKGPFVNVVIITLFVFFRNMYK